MADKSTTNENEVSRERLAELLNEDLAREYQAMTPGAENLTSKRPSSLRETPPRRPPEVWVLAVYCTFITSWVDICAFTFAFIYPSHWI
jgi:hypothetical protein